MDEPTSPDAIDEKPIKRAIRLAGGLSALSRQLGLGSHSVIYQWTLSRVPAERCPDIERITGVRCEELRPDVNWGVLRAAQPATQST